MTSIDLTPAIHNAAAAELESWDSLDEATGPAMAVTGTVLWSGEDDAEAGLWETTAGPSRWELETNEFIDVLAGRMTVTRDGDEPIEVNAGDCVFFPRGWTGTWEIHEPLRKCYVTF